MAKPSAERIKVAAEIANLSLTADEAKKLVNGESVKLETGKISPLGGCSGIKIVDLGNGCGLYLNPFPPSVSVCCET